MAHDVTESSPSWQAKMWPLLPSPTQTLLLQACLGPVGGIEGAWRKWCKQVREPRKLIQGDRWGIKAVLPLLHHSLGKGQVVLDKETQTLLRTAFFREQLRLATIRRLCRQLLQSLRAQTIDAVLTGDLAIAETAYDSPVLRHCGNIRLLLAKDEIERAVRHVRQENWRLVARTGQANGNYTLLDEQSGLELQMLSRLSLMHKGSDRAQGILSRSRKVLVNHQAIRLPCWADLLIEAMEYALIHGSWRRIDWVCDAAVLLKHPSEQDWSTFVEIVRRNCLSWPILAVLNYLRDSFGCCVPHAVFDDLSSLSSEDQKTCSQVAKFSARSAIRYSLTEAFYRAPDLPQRICVLIEIIRRSLRIIRKTLRDI